MALKKLNNNLHIDSESVQLCFFFGRYLFYYFGPWIILYSFFSTDNGPHYHNTAVLCYLSEVNEVFNVRLQQYNNFEAGEGKTALDTHFAHISHKIVRYVRLGNDLELQMGGMFWYKV